MMQAAPGASHESYFECRLESAHDLAALLSTLLLREKDQKEQRVLCEASGHGLKFAAQSGSKDTMVFAWMFRDFFKSYEYVGAREEIHMKLPVAEVMSCLQVFSERAGMVLRYPAGSQDQMRFRLEEDGNVTECKVYTLVLNESSMEAPAFFSTGERFSMFTPLQPETWHTALNEFSELDAPDVQLAITLHASEDRARVACVVLRVQTLVNDAEVELPEPCLDDSTLSNEVAAAGGVTYRYLLSSVVGSCLRAAKDAKAVKVRFNNDGAMSNMFIHRGRAGQKDLFVEALVSPLADVQDVAGMAGSISAAAAPSSRRTAGATKSGRVSQLFSASASLVE
mmetsp:Transcript_38591/g.70173  ORF Transcript_38591/g.70173 Transcript_38591/m.70173 type:complete len:339 (-) Transcript_38591:33-1049(-)